jgi:hypothetical protein
MHAAVEETSERTLQHAAEYLRGGGGDGALSSPFTVDKVSSMELGVESELEEVDLVEVVEALSDRLQELQAAYNEQGEALQRETTLRSAAEAREQMLELEREEDHAEVESAVNEMVGLSVRVQVEYSLPIAWKAPGFNPCEPIT